MPVNDAERALLAPEWSPPERVRACFSTRLGGVSRAPYASLNLGDHVGDDAAAVAQNRARFAAAAGLPRAPRWLRQVHGATVVRFDATPGDAPPPRADAAITRTTGLPCAVLVADCVPVLMAAADGREVAAAHAGWRGLEAGVLRATVAAFDAPAATLSAWIGPCIGVAAYRVGDDLRQHLLDTGSAGEDVFTAHADGWHLDLRRLAATQLRDAGVDAITMSSHCVHAGRDTFFSHRRDGTTGRMAAVVWIAD